MAYRAGPSPHRRCSRPAFLYACLPLRLPLTTPASNYGQVVEMALNIFRRRFPGLRHPGAWPAPRRLRPSGNLSLEKLPVSNCSTQGRCRRPLGRCPHRGHHPMDRPPPLALATASAAPVGAGGPYVPLRPLAPATRSGPCFGTGSSFRVSKRPGSTTSAACFGTGGPCVQNCRENLCMILDRARGHHFQRLGSVAPRPFIVDGRRADGACFAVVGAGARLLRLPRARLLHPLARRGAVLHGRPPGVSNHYD